MNNISTIREGLGMTRKELADRMGVTPPRITAIERAKRLQDETICKVAEALGVAAETVIVGPDPIGLEERFLTVKDVAAVLNISCDRARELIRRSIPHVNVGFKKYQYIRVRKKDLEAYIEGSKQNG